MATSQPLLLRPVEYGQSSDPSYLELAERVERVGVAGLKAEYEELLCECERPEGLTGMEAFRYPHKNRYQNVGCWDQTRVVLGSKAAGKENYDYIHANYVHGAFRAHQYIATQGPLDGASPSKDSTIQDFWRMVWEQSVIVVVMLCKTVDRGKRKCAQYWPNTMGQTLNLREYFITCLDSNERPIYDQCIHMCTLKLREKASGKERVLAHFCYPNWLDGDVQPSTRHTAAFLGRVADSHRRLCSRIGVSVDQSPLVVHCSAGIGRSGTLIAIDIAQTLLTVSGRADVRRIVSLLRAQRQLAVKSLHHYLCIYQALLVFIADRFQIPFDPAAFAAKINALPK